MARLHERHPDNVEGDWYVDDRCIDCDVSRQLAPELFGHGGGQAVVVRQPETGAEVEAAWRAALACPTQSIGTVSRRSRPEGLFPQQLDGDVYYCGFTSESSFGAHAYFVRRPEGNLLIDSPRWTRALAAPFEAMGGIAHVLLTHRDDVADADRYAEAFGARVWIHADDAAAAPYATDHFAGTDVVAIQRGVEAIPVPGHTRGSMVFLVGDRYLFTGDSLAWGRQRGDLRAFRRQCWYSWAEQTASLERLAHGKRFEWVLPGHGAWHGPVPADEMHARLLRLLDWMRTA